VRLLLTRPEPDVERTAAALRARGHDVVVMPLLRIEPLRDVELGAGPWGAVLLTSANACRALAAHKSFAQVVGRPAFAVGARTAEAARAAGFAEVVSADGDVAALTRLVASRLADKSLPLLYAAGETRAGDLAAALTADGFAVRMVILYRTVAAQEMAPDIRARLAAGGIDGVLHFSRRSAEAFLAVLSAAEPLSRSLKIQHYCLSPQVAAPLAAAGAASIRIAPEPHEQALLDMLVADRR
jgi:uroporphyrinogen-III synthase